MIQVSVLYANSEGSKFDIAYYCDKHIPMVKQLLGAALKRVAVEQGIAGMEPGSRAPYHAIGQLQFESLESFQSSFGPHAGQIVGDVPNYTNTQPIIQISEVKI
ncbi:MAG TPA: EthD family reductase [Candidatus Solibacter sp.]|nr:EthD family reductase [Candidatus Solibacter sp.]